MSSKHVKCHNCGTHIDLSQALYDEIKASMEEGIASEVDARTKNLVGQVEALTEKLAESENSASFKDVEVAALKKKLETSESNKEVEFEMRLANERDQLNREVKSQMEGYKKAVEETSTLAVKEKDETIRQLKEQLEIAHQKAEQGSMQLQGEAQELVIEEYLRDQFPLDRVIEVKKGAMGGDTFHTINTRESVGVGSIYYESKRTKAFNNAWIDKFKQDMINAGADAGILISSVRPTGHDRAVMIKGIWVCSIEEFKVLCHAVRAQILAVNDAKATQENKTDKMSIMYDYLTSSEFKMQVEAIVDGFSQIQTDLESEKRSMNAIWSKREKQIAKVINNTVGMYGSIKGIGGNAIGEIKSLELK